MQIKTYVDAIDVIVGLGFLRHSSYIDTEFRCKLVTSFEIDVIDYKYLYILNI